MFRTWGSNVLNFNGERANDLDEFYSCLCNNPGYRGAAKATLQLNKFERFWLARGTSIGKRRAPSTFILSYFRTCKQMFRWDETGASPVWYFHRDPTGETGHHNTSKLDSLTLKRKCVFAVDRLFFAPSWGHNTIAGNAGSNTTSKREGDV